MQCQAIPPEVPAGEVRAMYMFIRAIYVPCIGVGGVHASVNQLLKLTNPNHAYTLINTYFNTHTYTGSGNSSQFSFGTPRGSEFDDPEEREYVCIYI